MTNNSTRKNFKNRYLTLSSFVWGWLILLIIPQASFFYFKTSSLATGLFVAIVIWFVLILLEYQPYKVIPTKIQLRNMMVAFSVLISWTLLSSVITEGTDFSRLLTSFMFLLIASFISVIIANTLVLQKNSTLVRAGLIGIACMIIMLVSALVGFSIDFNGDHEKPIMIFTEPSHFALAVSPFLIFLICVSETKKRWIILLGTFVSALIVHNLTLLLISILLCILVFRIRKFLYVFIPVIIVIINVDLTYFISRIDITNPNENISLLVFLSGWERAILDLKNSYFMGVGFQQFGIVGDEGNYLYEIKNQTLNHESLNLYDGGSNAPKIIGEFGVLGVLMVMAYINKLIKSIKQLRMLTGSNKGINSNNYEVQLALSNAFIVSSFFDMFVRGQGYFSVGPFLLLVGLNVRKSTTKNY